MNFHSWDRYACLRANRISQSTREGAILGIRWHCCSSNLLINFWAVGKYLHIIWISGCYFQKCLFIDFRVCGVFFLYFVKDKQIWGSDWLQGVVSDTVVSSTECKSIFESSNSVRIRRPKNWSQAGFFKKFWVWWFKNTAISWIIRTNFSFKTQSLDSFLRLFFKDISWAFA